MDDVTEESPEPEATEEPEPTEEAESEAAGAHSYILFTAGTILLIVLVIVIIFCGGVCFCRGWCR